MFFSPIGMNEPLGTIGGGRSENLGGKEVKKIPEDGEKDTGNELGLRWVFGIGHGFEHGKLARRQVCFLSCCMEKAVPDLASAVQKMHRRLGKLD